MDPRSCFRLPRLLLPRPGVDLRKWAVIACDQYTSEPAYWERVAAVVGDAPSTLRLILPEAQLAQPDTPARIGRIHDAMRRYLDDGLLVEHAGPVLVERTTHGGARHGLLLELDLEQYDYGRASTSAIRPTEGTIVARVAPRVEVRRDALLELPHVLVLVDDPAGTVLEPLVAARDALAPLYASELMEGGGRVAGWAVDGERARRAGDALRALAEPAAFATRYGVAAGTPPMLFAVGDGNHSLAAAKSCWDAIKGSAGVDHPARYALVEVENIHAPALLIAPIHRLLFGVARDVRQALAAAFPGRLDLTDVPTAAAMRARVAAAAPDRHAAGLVGPGDRHAVVEVRSPASTLAVGTFQAFLDDFLAGGGAAEIDYVHGDDALLRLAAERGGVGFHLPAVGKHDLLRMVVREGPLPRKSFSMGEADEKRFYVEARRIR